MFLQQKSTTHLATASQRHSVTRLLAEHQYCLRAFPNDHSSHSWWKKGVKTWENLSCFLHVRWTTTYLSFWSILPADLCVYQHTGTESALPLCLAFCRDSPNSRVLVGYTTFSFAVPHLHTETDMGAALIITQSWKKSCGPLFLEKTDFERLLLTNGDSWPDRATKKTD